MKEAKYLRFEHIHEEAEEALPGSAWSDPGSFLKVRAVTSTRGTLLSGMKVRDSADQRLGPDREIRV